MMRDRLPAWVLLAAAFGAASIEARPPAVLATADIERALRVARSNESERRQFHAPYQVAVTEPLVESLEVITEYRRLVLIAEERMATSAWSYTISIRAAEDAMRPWTDKLSIRSRIRFHPLKSYSKVPDVAILLGDPPAVVRPLKTDTVPQYANARGGVAAPMTGVLVEGIFDAAAIEKRRLVVTVRGPDTMDVRGSIDLSTLR